MTTFMIKGSFGGLTFQVKIEVIGEMLWHLQLFSPCYIIYITIRLSLKSWDIQLICRQTQ